MSWDNKKLLKEIKTALANNKYPGISLFPGIANTKEEGMEIDLAAWTPPEALSLTGVYAENDHLRGLRNWSGAQRQ